MMQPQNAKPTELTEQQERRITTICENFYFSTNISGFYVTTRISDKKRDNALRYHDIPENSRIIAIIDNTVFRSAKYGMVITSTGIGWSNPKLSKKPGRVFMRWEQFIDQDIAQANFRNIRIGREEYFNFSYIEFSVNDLINLLEQIQQESQRLEIADYPEKAPELDLTQPPEWAEQLIEICAEFSSGEHNIFLAELISEKKITAAQNYYPQPSANTIAALIDNTVFGSAKYGVMITDWGVSWRNDWTAKYPSKDTALSWNEFIDQDIVQVDKGNVRIGSVNYIAQLNYKLLYELFIAIQTALKNRTGKPTLLYEAEYVALKSKSDSVLTNTIIDVNQADIDALITLPGIGIAEAGLLLQHRRANHYPASVEELIELLNLKPHYFARLKDKVTFSQVESINKVIEPEVNSGRLSESRTRGRIID